jgi:hypothetical protein
MPILREFEKEFSSMASMGDMPDVARNIMPLCSGHRFFPIRAFLASKNAL